MTDRHTVTLRDGRTLSYLVAGDLEGVPALFTIGSPSSAVGGLAFSPAAARNGVKLISIDKPGYAGSTRDPRRTLTQYGQDVVQLTDHLGLERVALIGQSGGGPHAIAAAHALGERASALLLLSSAGPMAEAWAREGLNPVMRSLWFFATKVPAGLGIPVAGLKLMMGDAQRFERMNAKMASRMSESDRVEMSRPEAKQVVEGLAEAFANGNGAVADEFYALNRPLGFPLSEVTTDTDLWHGTNDRSCPIAMARQLASRLPNATIHELPGVGHGFFGPELDEAMATVNKKACL